MTTQSGKDPLRRETSSHEHNDYLTESLNESTSSSRRDRISQKKKALEEKRHNYENKYGSTTSQKPPSSKISGQDPPQNKLGKSSSYGWGEIKDSPADSSEGEGGVHWLDALLAENLSPAEFSDRIKERNAQLDPDIEHLKQLNAELDATMQRHKEKAAEILKKKEELSALKSTGKPPRRAGRPGDRTSSENEYQRVEGERSRRKREYGEPPQPFDWFTPEVRNVNGGNANGYEDMENWGKPTHKESQDPVIQAADEVEPTKPSDSDKSNEHENAEDWWKPFQRAPREPVTTTLQDPARVRSSTKSVKWGEGLGAGGKHIQPFAGGRLPFHNEPESPIDAAERLENQLRANEDYKHKSRYKSPTVMDFEEPLVSSKQYKTKKSTPLHDKAVQNAPLPDPSAARINPHSQNDHAGKLSWMEIAIIVVIGMLLGRLALTITGVTSEKQDISGSLKWGLGKTVE
ncbi:hypothetical protein BELL_0666g00050 [Botrytis elliptica]|uniref:Uncharacterized protein n=1 Tax=Botrytis elliptica TaxID=278938 RepID=A0A4Z1JC12_9HELO|nr:hypothetical protein EAE99_001501 [Botrytis elliptica]TGO70784.1 hypothetical protein BELL_0666g00050 [Botrytis elliptica]